MREYTIFELQKIADSAFNYLKKHFEENVRHNFVITRNKITRNNLPDYELTFFKPYGTKKAPVDAITFDEKKLIKKLRSGKIEDDFEDKLPMILDEVIGGEVGAILFYAKHDVNNFGLEEAQELTRYYSGMIYTNRRKRDNPLFLRPYRDENYERARKLYVRFKDTKLSELASVKDEDSYNDLISRLEI